MALVPCPKCGEKERFAPTYTTTETYWTCQRCGYTDRKKAPEREGTE